MFSRALAQQRLIYILGENRGFHVELGGKIGHGCAEHGRQHDSDQAMRQQRQAGDRVSRFAGIGQAHAGQFRINYAHRHGRNEPQESPGEKQSAAEQCDFARRTLVVHAEVALCHGAGVVAERDHDRPGGDVEPAKLP